MPKKDKFMSNNTNFIAILPADIRYSKKINSMEKLIWAEISARLNKNGYCSDSLKDLAQIFSVDKSTISKSINKLENLGLIRIEVEAGKGRKIFLKGIHNSIEENLSFDAEVIKEAENTLKNQPLPKQLDQKVWNDWLKHHKDITKKDYTKVGLSRLLSRMEKLFNDGIDVNVLIERAIESNWKGFLFSEEKQIDKKENLMQVVNQYGFHLSDFIKAPNCTLKVHNQNIQAFCSNGKWKLRRLNE